MNGRLPGERMTSSSFHHQGSFRDDAIISDHGQPRGVFAHSVFVWMLGFPLPAGLGSKHPVMDGAPVARSQRSSACLDLSRFRAFYRLGGLLHDLAPVGKPLLSRPGSKRGDSGLILSPPRKCFRRSDIPVRLSGRINTSADPNMLHNATFLGSGKKWPGDGCRLQIRL